LKFPKEEAKALRTTNPIERLNKEFGSSDFLMGIG
jgi:transposase-like protein